MPSARDTALFAADKAFADAQVTAAKAWQHAMAEAEEKHRAAVKEAERLTEPP